MDRFQAPKEPEDVSLIIQYFLLGSLMMFGKKFNQLSFRLWGFDFILIANIKLMQFEKPNYWLL